MAVFRCARSFFILLLLLASTPLAFSQSVWLDRSIDRAIWLEVEKASFTEKYLSTGGFYDPPPKTTFATSNWYLSARWRMGELLFLKTEIPFLNAGLNGPAGFASYSENELGNPLVGLEITGSRNFTYGEIDVRIPVVDNRHPFSSEIGAYTDYDRYEAFLPQLWGFTSTVGVHLHDKTGLLLQLRAGPSFLVPTVKNGPNAQALIDYRIQAGYHFNRTAVLAGLTGRSMRTAIHTNNRSVDQFNLSASCVFGNFILALLFRAPLDKNLDDYIKSVFGLSLGYRLP